MANDWLSAILANKQQSGVMPAPEQDSDYLNNLLSQAPPIPDEAQYIAQKKTLRAMAPGPSDPTLQPLFPPEVYNDEYAKAKEMIANREPSEDEIKKFQDTLNQSKSEPPIESVPLEKLNIEVPPAPLEAKPEEDLSLSNLPRMKAPIESAPNDYMKALLAAQDESSRMAGLQMIGKGAERIGSAIAHVPHDKDYLNEMTPMIQQSERDVMNQQKIGAAGLDEQLKRRDVAIKQDMDDPNSTASVMARQILKQGAPTLKTEGLSATQMNEMLPGLKTVLETQLNREAKHDAMILRTEAAKEKAIEKKTLHDEDKQRSALLNLTNKLSTTRGQPAVGQAEKDIFAASKADELMRQYPDPNNMPLAQAKMLTIEVAKIAQGGIPTKTELDALTPDSIKGKLSGVVSKLINHPTPANAGAFLKQYQDYTHGITKQAEKVLTENYTRQIEADKPYLSSEDYKRLNEQFVDRFKPKAISNIPEGSVKIRRKKDGKVTTVPTEDAGKILQDPGFEIAK